MALIAGARVGSYEVLASIGAGGMGEVYRAHDPRLKRDVAIKVLPAAFGDNRERLTRFQREAEVLAALNHPNIAAIYGIEAAPSADVGVPPLQSLIMELVDGEDLAQRLARGPIPLDEALPIARQIADALEAAHEQGIVHRDLKPANVKVRTDGTVKVLDFGLAKVWGPAEAGHYGSPSTGAGHGIQADPAISPTLTAATQLGVILGTAAYMAPEQAKGKPVDKRADIWAFGCVLYEMLTGKRVFDGEDVTETIAAVVTKMPEWTLLPKATPPAVTHLLTRCIEKNASRRLRDIGEARVALENASVDPAHSAPDARDRLVVVARVRFWRRLAIASATLFIASFAPALLYLAGGRQIDQPEARFEIPTPATDRPASFAISPDGTKVVYVANQADAPILWLRRINAIDARPLTATRGAAFPFWSPDNRSVGFFADDRAMMRVDLETGAVQSIARTTVARGATWNADGVIVYAPSNVSPLYRISALGGDPVPLTELGQDRSHRFPVFLPDGRHFLYVAQPAGGQALYVASLDDPKGRRLVPTSSSAVIMPPRFIVHEVQRNLYAQPFDFQSLQLIGERFLIAQQIINDNQNVGASAAADGTWLYRTTTGTFRSQLTWFDRSGTHLGTVGPPAPAAEVAIAPNGREVVMRRGSDLWIADLARDVLTPFTSGDEGGSWPVWSADGRRVAYNSRAGIVARSREGAEQVLIAAADTQGLVVDWSRDGKYLLLQDTPAGSEDILVAPLDGDRTRRPFAASKFSERRAHFSPDGRWVIYESSESGRSEIYVASFARPSARIQLSTDGGSLPRWSANGREVFFLDPESRMMAVRVSEAPGGTSMTAERPVMLFQTQIRRQIGLDSGYPYDVAPDGRFLITVQLEAVQVAPIAVVRNWKPPVR